MTFPELISIEPFNWSAIGTSLLCGAIIGTERQLRGKPVGIRTSTLITLGTYLFIAASMAVGNNMTDPSRIIGQVITGIGFLGAGVMMSKDGVVVGVTSAATIWSLAAIGVSISTGNLLTSIKLSGVVIFILIGVDLLEDYSTAFTRGVHAKVIDWRQGTKKDSNTEKE
jgi:putative Mg2+ transporter-C (MgtC) family protein